jgi:hypothetical protein
MIWGDKVNLVLGIGLGIIFQTVNIINDAPKDQPWLDGNYLIC